MTLLDVIMLGLFFAVLIARLMEKLGIKEEV